MGDVNPPPPIGLREYQDRCEQLDTTLKRAKVVYESDRTMIRGSSTLVVVAVTLDEVTPPDQILGKSDVTIKEGYHVSCRIQARLMVSSNEFDLNQTDWVDRSFLTLDTVRWSWFITARIGGAKKLVVQLRPVVKLQTSGSVTDTAVGEHDIEEIYIDVHVTVPWTERPQETMARLAATFKVAESLVTAVTGLILALLALLAAVGIKGWRRHARRTGKAAARATTD